MVAEMADEKAINSETIQSGVNSEPLSPRQLAQQRKRSIAIALGLLVLVAMFYILTIVKMGPDLFTRAI